MEDIIKLQQEFESLIVQLERLKSINELTSENTESAKQVISKVENFTSTLGQITKTYLEGNNAMFVEKLKEFQTNINMFENEVVRLIDTDFTSLFNDLQKAFIIKTKADIEIELHKFDEKVKNFQPVINSIKNEAERLEGIDLEKYFDLHKKTLTDILGAINSTNITLTSITQGLSGIAQSITYIENSIITNFKETNQQIVSFNKRISDQLEQQSETSKNNIKLFDEKIFSISNQNELLKNELKTNRIIQIVGFILVVISFFIIKH